MSQFISLNSSPNQQLSVALSINGGTVTLQLAVRFNEMAGYWVMSIADPQGVPLISTIPLVTGTYPAANLLLPYQYMNIGSAYVINISGVTSPDYPNANNLGTDFQVLWDDNTDYIATCAGTSPGAILKPMAGFTTSCVGPQGPPGPQGLPGMGAANGGFALLTSDLSNNIHPDISLGLSMEIQLQATATTTGSAPANSPALTVANGAGIQVGNLVSGLNIPPGTTIIAGSGTSWTMSANTTAAIPAATPLIFDQQLTVQPPVWTNNFLVPGMMFNLLQKQDALGNHPNPIFVTVATGGPATGSYAVDANQKYPGTAGGTWTIFTFFYTGVAWIVINFWTNIASQ